MSLSVLSIAIAAFVLGASEFVIVGLLPNISSDLGVSISMAGYLVTWYAFGVAIGGPLFIVSVLRMPKKGALLSLMGLFLVGNIVSALSPTYEVLLISRLITSLAVGAFFGIGFVLATEVVPENKQASSISLIVMGFTLANVIGVPIGTAIGQNYGWRASFWFIVLLSAITFLAIMFLVPKLAAKKVSVKKEFTVLKSPAVWLSLLIVVVSYIGFHMIMTYITPILITVSGFEMHYVSIILSIIGVSLTVGSTIGGKYADKKLSTTLITTLIAFAIITLIFTFTMHYKYLSVITLVLWAMAIFGAVPALQLKVMKAAGDAPNVASTLGISAFNLGIGGGALVGGRLLSEGVELTSLPLYAGLVILVSVGIAAFSFRFK